MTIYKLVKYNRMEDTYEEALYTKKENAEKAVETVKRNYENKKSIVYKNAWIEEIKTEDQKSQKLFFFIEDC